jgi:hypothetical protein
MYDFLPGKIGYPRTSSAMMHPTLQISVGLPYNEDPNKIYGDRYHLVATSSERIS